jgi:hypothetical protein
MWDPQRLTTLWASTVCYGDSFTFFYLLLILQISWIRNTCILYSACAVPTMWKPCVISLSPRMTLRRRFIGMCQSVLQQTEAMKYREPCSLRFHLSHFQFSETEFACYADCKVYISKWRLHVPKITTKPCSSSTLDLPEREENPKC